MAQAAWASDAPAPVRPTDTAATAAEQCNKTSSTATRTSTTRYHNTHRLVAERGWEALPDCAPIHGINFLCVYVLYLNFHILTYGASLGLYMVMGKSDPPLQPNAGGKCSLWWLGGLSRTCQRRKTHPSLLAARMAAHRPARACSGGHRSQAVSLLWRTRDRRTAPQLAKGCLLCVPRACIAQFCRPHLGC